MEKIAHQVRIDKSACPAASGNSLASTKALVTLPPEIIPPTAEWSAHIDDLKKWIAAIRDLRPRVFALAQAYIQYAWFARGSGYSNSVAEFHWELFGQRIALAKATLIEAAHLKEKCPYWYEAMLIVALAEGWTKNRPANFSIRPPAFDSTYYHYYREYAKLPLTQMAW